MLNKNAKTNAKNAAPLPFNPLAVYPPYDNSATEVIGDKQVSFIYSLLDTRYQNEVPESLNNLSVLAPDDHLIRDAITHNIAIELLVHLRPRGPLLWLEYILMPDHFLKLRKEKIETEKFLKNSLNGTKERKAALARVINSLPFERINLLSQPARDIALQVSAKRIPTKSSFFS